MFGDLFGERLVGFKRLEKKAARVGHTFIVKDYFGISVLFRMCRHSKRVPIYLGFQPRDEEWTRRFKGHLRE